MWKARAAIGRAVSTVKVLVNGSKVSAVISFPGDGISPIPPTINTRPSRSKVTVCKALELVIGVSVELNTPGGAASTVSTSVNIVNENATVLQFINSPPLFQNCLPMNGIENRFLVSWESNP